MHADGSGATQISPTDQSYYLHPSWSPDGTKIAVVGGDGSLYLLNANGSGSPTELTNARNGYALSEPAWGDDGWLYYVEKQAFNYTEIWRIDTDGSSGTSRQSVVSGYQRRDDQPTVSLDGDTLAFTCMSSGTEDICTAPADGSGSITNVTNTSGAVELSPDFVETTHPSSSTSVANVVAMGDSVVAGEGLHYDWYWDGDSWVRGDPNAPGWDTNSTASGYYCHGSKSSYPFTVAFEKNWELTHVACSSAGALNGILSKQDFGNNVLADNAQLGSNFGYDPANSYYDSANPDYVILGAGANDVQFESWVLDCALNVNCGGPADSADFASDLADAEDHLEEVLSEIEARDNPDPTVLLTTYYDPSPSPYTTCTDIKYLIFTNFEVGWLRDRLDDLNDMIRRVALAHSNVDVVELETAMDGHRYCSSDPWIYGPSIAEQSGEGDSNAPLPPNADRAGSNC